MKTQNSTQQANNYFNLHTHGMGYLSRIREVQPKKGSSFLACQIAALTGPSDNPEYRYFDVNVVGKDAETLIRKCEQAVEAQKKVLISFVIADLWTDTFTYSTESKFHKKGDTGVSLKGRLVRIKMIKIDGELKYQEQPKQNEAAANSEA